MTPDRVLQHAPLVLEQRMRERYFEDGFLTVPGFATNSYGIRGQDPTGLDSFRILAIGGSTTEEAYTAPYDMGRERGKERRDDS